MKMNDKDFYIREYSSKDRKTVIELWQKCNLTRPWNNPKLDIERKLKVNPELFLVGLLNGKVIATVMGGYEGHRGWINYLAVKPDYQKRGLGRQIMKAIEEKLLAIGCPKINLMIRTDNPSAVSFYEKIGFKTDDVISMGKRLLEDN
jgi:ribosomal protein S18 acetylase RimI-like enzyme